jgi:hypothetical protein
MTKQFLLVAIAVAALVSPALQGQAPSGVTIYEGARVIVGDGSAPLNNASCSL